VPRLQIAVPLANLKLPFLKALHTAAELGADAVEIDARGEVGPGQLSRTGLRQVRKMLDDLHLRVSAVVYHTRRGYDVPDDLERRIDGTKRALQFAYDLGAAVVVNHVGRVPLEPQGAAWERLLQSLAEIGAHGQRVGATLAAVTGTEAGEDLARLIRSLPAGSLGATYDPGNLVIQGFSATSSLAALAEHVLHVHARDAVRDLTRGRGVETALGQGAVDFTEILGTLEQSGYRGYYTVVREQTDDLQRDLRQAMHYLRSL
jgi:sugar phosphate isomerase/epimerase